jgi:hypothetical protein
MKYFNKYYIVANKSIIYVVPGSLAELNYVKTMVSAIYYTDSNWAIYSKYEKRNLWHLGKPYGKPSKNDTRHTALTPAGKVRIVVC